MKWLDRLLGKKKTIDDFVHPVKRNEFGFPIAEEMQYVSNHVPMLPVGDRVERNQWGYSLLPTEEDKKKY